MQVVITVGSLCVGELMWDRLSIAAVVTPVVMFMFSVTSLMLIASSFVMTKLMMIVTYSLKLIVAMVIASSWRESSCWRRRR
jgi:sensor domain CHASE-containing protein